MDAGAQLYSLILAGVRAYGAMAPFVLYLLYDLRETRTRNTALEQQLAQANGSAFGALRAITRLLKNEDGGDDAR